jgi:acyl-coenzyme A synthetase/AMP-(fatty) acid ligase
MNQANSPQVSVIERIAEALQRRPLQPAVEFRGRWYDWFTLAEGGDAICRPFEARGLCAGMSVALVARNRPGHVAALLSLLARGFCVQMVYAFQPSSQLALELCSLDVAGVVLDEEDADERVVESLSKRGVTLVSVDGLLDRPARSLLPGGPALPKLRDDGVAIEMLTSGTTGVPKRVAIRKDTLHLATEGMIRAGAGAMNADILSFPIGNISGLYYLIPACANHTPLALLERFNLDDWLRAVALHRPRYCALPPAAIRMLLDANVPAEALAGLESVGVGASRLEPSTQAEFQSRYGLPVLVGYGATEFCGVVAAWTIEEHQRFAASKLGSVGRARPGVELRVVDISTGKVVAVDQVGVIEARVDRIGPEFVRTTDLGSLDVDGFLFLHGRADDVINRGGFKVHPQKIEGLLREHPSVAEAAVVSRLDARLGEVPVAVIELRPGMAEPESGELEALLREHLRAPEIPERFVYVQALPRTPSMKVKRVDVRALVEAASA